MQFTKQQLETSFRKGLSQSRIMLFFQILIIGVCAFIYFCTDIEKVRNALLISAAVGLALWFFIIAWQILSLYSASVRIEKADSKMTGNYSVEEIRELVSSVINEFKNKEIPNIYILDSKIVNAYAVDTWLVNFIRPFNAVYISKRAFECMSEGELKATLLHELGHFYRYDYAGNRLRIPRFLFMSLPFAFIVLIPHGWKFLFAATLAYIVLKIISFPAKRDDRIMEYLSDLFAAERVGKLNMINTLIILGNEYKKLEENEKAISKVAAKVNPAKKRVLIRWSDFDTEIVNSKIEPEEYDKFIEAILNENEAKVIDSAIDEDSVTHPSLTRRILFLHNNCDKL